MTISKVDYLGALRCTATHIKSNTSITSDAPIDNNGKGESFSPTDCVATSLATCMITIMGIRAEKMDINLTGITASVGKSMTQEPPRKIAEVDVAINMPAHLNPQERAILEKAALTCPVGLSLHPDIRQNINFSYH